ncbi:hypothetical protein P4T50_02585, partial [Bacillus paralicheniformis]|nr:hypothetical protein [Bacillus paralicheniformis]MED0697193.1 hypothetical protein [Bacillus paralicheniformis]MED1241328.1 hypothetical protein [Bacillus paralicheniformis]
TIKSEEPKLIKVKIKQYRTSKPVKDGSMCYKQYKYKHKSTWHYKKKQSKQQSSSLFLQSKPC